MCPVINANNRDTRHDLTRMGRSGPRLTPAFCNAPLESVSGGSREHSWLKFRFKIEDCGFSELRGRHDAMVQHDRFRGALRGLGG
jgi:hypothetical protein